MRYLVTGGTGFIGQHLVAHLLAGGDELVLLLREGYAGGPLPGKLKELRPHLHLVYADLRNYNLTARAVRDAAPEQIIHLAAAGVNDPFLSSNNALSHNLTGTLNLLRASFEANRTARQMIVARTPGEVTAMNVYAASKAAAWQFCLMYARTQAWPIIGGMVFQAYGPGQNKRALLPMAAMAAAAGHDFPMTNGQQQRDWIYIDDVVRGFQAIGQKELPPGITVELGTGQSYSLAEAVQMIYRLCNQGGQPLLGVLPQRPGEINHQQADAAAAYTLTGWQAHTPLREGLTRLIKHSSQPRPGDENSQGEGAE